MLKIEGIHKTYYSSDNPENSKHVLKGIDLTINDGDFIAVIGGNGSGKTTLLNCVAGLLNIDEGKIYLDDIDITNLSAHKRANDIARVFQDPNSGTISNMSLIQNLALASQRGERKKPFRWSQTKEKRERFKQLLIELDTGLEDRLDVQLSSFSGGQRQLITLIMATLNTPKLLLLDEHTAALDPKVAKHVMELTKKIVSKGNISTLMITHNMKDAIKYGNRLIMMADGKIIFEASGEEKKKLTVEELVSKFTQLTEEDLGDSLLLN